MRICIVAEGCYPYVVGGVSSWIHSMINSFPNTEFIVLAIVANRSIRGKFVYDIPKNVTEIYELYLEDYDCQKRRPEKDLILSNIRRSEVLYLTDMSTGKHYLNCLQKMIYLLTE